MALWEYKVITSGKGGFATPALLESFLNQLGTEEWEIIEFRAQPDNPLAFHGLARRPTQRDWTLEAAAAAAARAEADKLRAEFAAKFQAATSPGQEAAAQDPGSGNPNRDDSFRRPRDTEYDQDPYAIDDSAEDEADAIPEEDQLPTFFEAIRPHMRRNQKGPGHSVGLEFLIKKFDLIEEDLLKALTECGFVVPEDEDDTPTYIEYDGDLYWLNVNRRGEIWINTREKPRQVFRVAKGNVYSAPKPEETLHAPAGAEGVVPEKNVTERPEGEGSEGSQQGGPEQAAVPAGEQPQQEPASPQQVLPEGAALLDRLRKLMRRSRGGWSGTISYMARALRRSEAELSAALAPLGLVPPATPNEKAPVVEVGELAYWLNKDGRGGIWVNVREARRMRKEAQGEAAAEGAGQTPEQSGGAAAAGDVPAAEAVSAGVTEVAPVGQDAVVSGEPGQPDPTAQEKAAALAAVYAGIATEAPVAASSASGEPSGAAAPAEQPPVLAAPEVATPVAVPAAAAEVIQAAPATSSEPFAAVRPFMKETRRGNYSGEICFLAEKADKPVEPLVSLFVGAGLRVPEKPREKPVYVENQGDLFWFTRNSKGELWLNARPSSQPPDSKDEEPEEESSEAAPEGASEEKKTRRPRRRTKSEE